MTDNFHMAMRIREQAKQKIQEKEIRHDNVMREKMSKSNPQNFGHIQNIMNSPLYKTAKEIDTRSKTREFIKDQLNKNLEIMTDEQLNKFASQLVDLPQG
jgi:hypothetical protein